MRFRFNECAKDSFKPVIVLAFIDESAFVIVRGSGVKVNSNGVDGEEVAGAARFARRRV